MRYCLSPCIHVLYYDIAAGNGVMRIYVSYGLRLTWEVTGYITLYLFKGIVRDCFLLCWVGISNISCFHYIMRYCFSLCIHVLRCDIATRNWIVRIYVSHGLHFFCKMTGCIALNFFKRITWNDFLFCWVRFSNIPLFYYIIRDLFALCVHILDSNVPSRNWNFFIKIRNIRGIIR